MIDSLSDEELFKPHMRKWADEATKTAVWEVYKFNLNLTSTKFIFHKKYDRLLFNETVIFLF